jgi:hypothetical protein
MTAVIVAAVLVGGAGKKRFMAIEVATSPIEVTRTISGLIFTPSVSSSKNLSRPALDAGSGLFFFLPLIAYHFCRAHALLKYVANQIIAQKQ